MVLFVLTSIIVSYLVVLVVLLLLVVNVFFRLKILKSYNKLKNNKIEFQPGMITNIEKAKAFFKSNYPEQADDLISFVRQLRRLFLYSFAGLIVIVTIFLVVYLNK